MRTERLKAAVETLTAILSEVQNEVNEFQAERSEWYSQQLRLLRSELMSGYQFDKYVWNVNKELWNYLDDDLCAITQATHNIVRKYEAFLQTRDRLKNVTATSVAYKPCYWKEFEVVFKFKSGREDSELYYGPEANYAKKMFEKWHDSDGAEFIKIEEVCHEKN